MANRQVFKVFFPLVTYNALSAAGERGKAFRELALSACGVGVQSGHGPKVLGRWTLALPADSKVQLCSASGSVAACDAMATALESAGAVGPDASHELLTRTAAATLGCPTADVLVSRVDAEALSFALRALGAESADPAELSRAVNAWKVLDKASNDTSKATDSDTPRVTSSKASKGATVAPAVFAPSQSFAALRAMLDATARQCATAYVVSTDNSIRGTLGLIGRELAAMSGAIIATDPATYSMRAEITVGSQVTGKRLDNGEQHSGTVRKLSPKAITLTERDADGDALMLSADGAVATVDGTAVNDALSIWGFDVPADPATPTADTSTDPAPTDPATAEILDARAYPKSSTVQVDLDTGSTVQVDPADATSSEAPVVLSRKARRAANASK